MAARPVGAVETNTIFDVRPGALALMFGMYGGRLRCPYCHSWRLSHSLRDEVDDVVPEEFAPAALVGAALPVGCRVLCRAYNEPTLRSASSRTVRCPLSQTVLVERANYRTLAVRIENGRCPARGGAVPGLWDRGFTCGARPRRDRRG